MSFKLTEESKLTLTLEDKIELLRIYTIKDDILDRLLLTMIIVECDPDISGGPNVPREMVAMATIFNIVRYLDLHEEDRLPTLKVLQSIADQNNKTDWASSKKAISEMIVFITKRYSL
jgi:hypothetical protein